MIKHTLAIAAALALSVSAAAAMQPPPDGYYGYFRLPQINCPTEDDALSVFAGLLQSKAPVDDVERISAAFNCTLGYVGEVAVGESHLLGDMVGPEGKVTFYSVHVGTIQKEWWLVYGDNGAEHKPEAK